LSSSRYRPPTPLPPIKKPEPKVEKPQDGNALWRVPEWYPALSPKVLEQLKMFHVELLRFNAKVNLISRNTERDADEAHFADCILAVQILLGAGLEKKVFDIGSGNGFPGIILGIMDPSREYVLVESDSRKAEFLKHMSHILALKNIQIMNVRLESLIGQGVTCGVSRGFASISKTVLALNKIFPKDGKFFHLKGNSWSSEIAELPSQLISLWAPQLVGDYTLPVTQARRAIVITQKKH
jgi:16S rRNA (guanine527-N7)-methyltransferase